MPSQDNIDVRVIVDNNDLIEYADPQDSVDRDQVQKRYVEAKVDARFRVQIKLLEGFNFKEADSVYCTVKIDEASILREFVIRKDKSQHRKCIIYEEMVDEVRRITHFNPETFAWESCPLLFGVIESDGVPDESSNLTKKEAQKIGSIRVKVFRATEKPAGLTNQRWEVLEAVPKSLLEGKVIKNNMKYGPGIPFVRSASKRDEMRHVYDRIKGKAGRPFEFHFLYRNIQILRNLGVVPRTPSPVPQVPDANQIIEATQEMLRETKRKYREQVHEIEQLKRRVSELEGGPKRLIDGEDILDIFEPKPKRVKF